MITKDRIGLNRIVYPQVGLEEFFAVTAELGLHKVELRNDLPGGRVTDDLSPEQVRDLAGKYGIEVLTINALQKFNLPGNLQKASGELKSLLELARSIGCRAVVLCPNNDPSDARTKEQSLRDTTAALKAFGPQFEEAGVLGYIEPLGFPESSLDSLLAGARAIREADSDRYRMVYDTFHHYLGPDDGAAVEQKLDVSLIGLVHASGVVEDLDRKVLKDDHRVLVTQDDRMGNIEQIARLTSLGYRGNISLEPFSARVQQLERKEFLKAAAASIELLTRS